MPEFIDPLYHISGKLLAKQNKAKELANLIKSIRPFLGVVSKAKASKIVRELVDTFLDMGSNTGLEVPLCLECIDWAKRLVCSTRLMFHSPSKSTFLSII